MNSSLPDEMKVFVEAQMAHEGSASAGEYVRAPIRDAQRRKSRQGLEAQLLEGLEGAEMEMDCAEWDSIRREALDGLAGGSIL